MCPKGVSLSSFLSVLSYFGTPTSAKDLLPHPSETLGYKQSFTNKCACISGVSEARDWFHVTLEAHISTGLPTSHIVLVAYSDRDSNSHLADRSDPDALVRHMGETYSYSHVGNAKAKSHAFWMSKQEHRDR